MVGELPPWVSRAFRSQSEDHLSCYGIILTLAALSQSEAGDVTEILS